MCISLTRVSNLRKELPGKSSMKRFRDEERGSYSSWVCGRGRVAEKTTVGNIAYTTAARAMLETRVIQQA